VSSEKNETITDAGGDGQVDIRVEPAISRPAGRGERHGSTPHRQFPVKLRVIGHILQEQVLHLAGDLSPFLDSKRLALCPKEGIELRVTIPPEV
jgi:hypothetical protein